MARISDEQLPPLEEVATLAFGGPATTPAQACGPLRATAARAGWQLLPAADTDLAAAALGAHLCASLHPQHRLPDGLAPQGDDRVGQVLKRTLLRAAGTPLWLPPPVDGQLPPVRLDDPGLRVGRAVRSSARWLATLPVRTEAVTAQLSRDLAAAGPTLREALRQLTAG